MTQHIVLDDHDFVRLPMTETFIHDGHCGADYTLGMVGEQWVWAAAVGDTVLTPGLWEPRPLEARDAFASARLAVEAWQEVTA